MIPCEVCRRPIVAQPGKVWVHAHNSLIVCREIDYAGVATPPPLRARSEADAFIAARI